MLFSELYKIVVNKVTIVVLAWGNCPNRPPLDPPLPEKTSFVIANSGRWPSFQSLFKVWSIARKYRYLFHAKVLEKDAFQHTFLISS